MLLLFNFNWIQLIVVSLIIKYCFSDYCSSDLPTKYISPQGVLVNNQLYFFGKFDNDEVPTIRSYDFNKIKNPDQEPKTYKIKLEVGEESQLFAPPDSQALYLFNGVIKIKESKKLEEKKSTLFQCIDIQKLTNGENDTSCSDSINTLKLQSSTRPIENLPHNRYSLTLIKGPDQWGLYIFGGCIYSSEASDFVASNRFFRYGFTNNEWWSLTNSIIKDLPFLVNHAAAYNEKDDQLVFVGGQKDKPASGRLNFPERDLKTTNLTQYYQYGIIKQEWSSINVPSSKCSLQPRHGHSAIFKNSALVVLGGLNQYNDPVDSNFTICELGRPGFQEKTVTYKDSQRDLRVGMHATVIANSQIVLAFGKRLGSKDPDLYLMDQDYKLQNSLLTSNDSNSPNSPNSATTIILITIFVTLIVLFIGFIGLYRYKYNHFPNFHPKHLGWLFKKSQKTSFSTTPGLQEPTPIWTESSRSSILLDTSVLAEHHPNTVMFCEHQGSSSTLLPSRAILRDSVLNIPSPSASLETLDFHRTITNDDNFDKNATTKL